MKIFPVSDTILLPLAPTIASTIADYLQLITQKFYVRLSQDCDNAVIELPQDLAWHWQFEQSIGLVPTSQYQYVSAIAHRLAAKSALTPLAICQQIQRQSFSLIVDPCSHIELCCWYNEAGYIYFQLTPRAIAAWLNYIHDLPLDFHPGGDRCSVEIDLSMAIYAHARCCSVLNLAVREQLVVINDDWQIGKSPAIDICPENQLLAAWTSIFEHSAEHRLIHALMAALDGIYSCNLQFDSHKKIPSPNWTKLTIDLARSWLEFHRHCRIFGDIKHQNPRLAIARCGLTAISRRYLQVLLKNYLGIDPSIEFQDSIESLKPRH